jgi:hypothetical protein
MFSKLHGIQRSNAQDFTLGIVKMLVERTVKYSGVSRMGVLRQEMIETASISLSLRDVRVHTVREEI